MFFILSTGRCGSTTIASVLNQSSDAVCIHEHQPKFIIEAPLYLYGELSHWYLTHTLKVTRPETIKGKQFGESNHNLSYMIPALKDVFPKAKFILLIRDGRTAVSSMFSRGWYTGSPELHEWDKWRIRGDKLRCISADKWMEMDPFEKICWHWSYKNSLIIDQLNKFECEWMDLRLEDFDSKLPAVFSFLGITQPEKLEVKKENKAPSHHKIIENSDWSPRQVKIFDLYCGELMKRYYPEYPAS